MPNVSFKVDEFRRLEKKYDLIRDCLAGEEQIKFRRNKYLPLPNAEDTSKENIERYNAYLTRAVFYNVAERTLAGLVGQVFLRDPAIDVPPGLDAVVEDANGSGTPIDQQAQEAADFVLPYGRAGLYVDYPDTESDGNEGATIEAIDNGTARPTINVIEPWEIINWREKKRGAKSVLSLVVFRENYTVEDDGFETKTKQQYRVLRLENDVYVNEIYRESNTQPYARFIPKDAKGQVFDEITFKFIGARKNEAKPSPPPMYALCALNIAHYRNSADYEEAVFLLGQPTAWFAGLTEEWVSKVLKGKLLLGARSAIPLPINASAGLLQVQPNTLAKEAMDQKEAQMLALGAKLVEGSQVERTATEADIDNVSETSVLSTVAKNVGAAFVWALKTCCRFTGDDDSAIAFDLNTEFDLVNLSPEERMQLLKEWQANGITTEEYRTNLRRGGIAYLDDEAYKSKSAADQADALARSVEEAAKLAEATQANQPPAGA